MAFDFTLTALVGIALLGILNQFWVSFYSVFFKERVERYLNGIKSNSKKVVTEIYLQGKQNANIYKGNTTTI